MGRYLHGRDYGQVVLGYLWPPDRSSGHSTVLYIFYNLDSFRWDRYFISLHTLPPLTVLCPVKLIPLCFLSGSFRHLSLGLPYMELLLLNNTADEVLIKDYVTNKWFRHRTSHWNKEGINVGVIEGRAHWEEQPSKDLFCEVNGHSTQSYLSLLVSQGVELPC